VAVVHTTADTPSGVYHLSTDISSFKEPLRDLCDKVLRVSTSYPIMMTPLTFHLCIECSCSTQGPWRASGQMTRDGLTGSAVSSA
jgi:hypothetical protein